MRMLDIYDECQISRIESRYHVLKFQHLSTDFNFQDLLVTIR